MFNGNTFLTVSVLAAMTLVSCAAGIMHERQRASSQIEAANNNAKNAIASSLGEMKRIETLQGDQYQKWTQDLLKEYNNKLKEKLKEQSEVYSKNCLLWRGAIRGAP